MTDELFIRQTGAPIGFTQPHILSGQPPDTPLLVALSGGADSRLLFALAVRYRDIYGTPIYAAHLHHGIRGAEADRDEAFCCAIAAADNVPLYVGHADIPALAAAHGRSIEHQARVSRYAFLADVMKEQHIPLLLTAHHADDQLETLLLRLLRGTGTRGMGGIPPARPMDGGWVLRPLLACTKASVLAACHTLGLTYVTDSTNETDDATRNRVRREVIPILEAIGGVGLPQAAAARLARAAREDDAYIAAQAKEIYAASVVPVTGALPLDTLRKAHPAVAKRILALAYAHTPPRSSDGSEAAPLTAAHLEALLSLCHKGIHGTSVSLGGRLEGRVCDHTLVFVSTDNRLTPAPAAPTALYEGHTLWDNGRMVIRVERWDAPPPPLEADGIIASALFSAAALPFPLWARHRAEGDVIRHHGVGRKLKKLLCDQGVPPSMRDRLPLICTREGIPLWFPTAGFADGYPPPVEGNTLRITIFSGDLCISRV